jgi:hypothetical protein
LEEEQTKQWPKEEVLKDKQRSIKHTHKTKQYLANRYIISASQLTTDILHLSSSLSGSFLNHDLPPYHHMFYKSKQLENLSDERVVLQFKRNPYYQYFCGYSNYMPGMPCNATE